MTAHVSAIVVGLAAFLLGNAASIGGGLYAEYRFRLIEKVEPYVTKALSFLRRVKV
jgi:hypothetical protein